MSFSAHYAEFSARTQPTPPVQKSPAGLWAIVDWPKPETVSPNLGLSRWIVCCRLLLHQPQKSHVPGVSPLVQPPHPPPKTHLVRVRVRVRLSRLNWREGASVSVKGFKSGTGLAALTGKPEGGYLNKLSPNQGGSPKKQGGLLGTRGKCSSLNPGINVHAVLPSS